MADEVSPRGDPIFVHEHREREPEPTAGDEDLVHAIHDHLERFFAREWAVFHENESDRVHIDVHVVPPGPNRDWITLVTSGMAELPMAVPEGLEDYRYVELLLALPSDWPILGYDRSFEDANTYWPLWLLKNLARLPHDHDTYLGYSHTVDNGERFAGTGFSGSLVAGACLTPEGFEELTLPDGRIVRFYAVYPLYPDELEFKLEYGCDALIDRLVANGVSEWVDVSRASVVEG